MSIDKFSIIVLMADAYKIDRKGASRLLKVSMRTVDRYIRAKKLSTEQRDGRIWLNRSEINKLRAPESSRQEVDTVDSEMSIDKTVSTPVDVSIDNDDSLSTPEDSITALKRQNSSSDIYKNLFEELQVELRQKQERLEGANYRVGQLEGILKESVPLPEHNRLLLSERAEKQRIEAEHTSLSTLTAQLKENLKDEKLTRKIFLAFIFLLMLLQPLWLWLSLSR